MSTYDDASLVFYPSGYKTSVLFSEKPMDANGQLTFTRASNATRVAPNGLIEEVRTNACLYSEDQTNWTTQDQTSVTANAAANPLNGATTADKVIPSAVTADHYRGLTMATMVGEITASIYVKADGYDFFDWGIYNNSASNYPVRAIFDLSTQAITYINGSAASITSIGSGWYRVSITCSVASSSSIALYHRVKASTTTGTYSGNGTSGMLLWGCQLESGVMTDYIGPTTTSARSTFAGITVDGTSVPNVPRIDYTGGGCGKLLLEPQRTNLVTFSEQFDNAAWTKDATTATANAAISPDGYTNADKIFETATTDFHRIYGPTISVTSGTAYTASIFVKAAEVTTFAIEMRLTSNVIDSTFNLVTGTATGNGIIQDYGNGWYRCILTGTATATGGGRPMFFLKQRSSYAGNTSNGILVYGAQFEAGSYATSYIPTLSTSVTRVADAASKTGISSLIGQTEGTVMVEYDQNLIGQAATRRIFALSDGTTSNRITAYIRSTNVIEFYVRNSGGDLFLAAASSPAGNTKGVHKIAAAYKNGDYAVYLDGALIISGTGTAGTIPACSRFDLGNQLGANDLYEPMMQALLFKTRLSNSTLARLTQL